MPDTAKPVVIFGQTDFASLAWHVLTHDTPLTVAAFTVDGAYLGADRFCGLPVTAFETLQDRFPPEDFQMLVPLGGRGANGFRRDRYLQAKAKGYEFATYVSSQALVAPGVPIGENCMIFEGAAVQAMASVGDNCIVRTLANVSHHVSLGDHGFVAASAVIGGGARIGERCFLGLGAVVRDGVTVAERCLVGAGAVVTRDTEPNGVYTGVPAKRGPRPADELDNV
ncbi:acetyltransferase [Phenylobacterium sp.]|uniref:acetyltransferase n=1 Tax=Phenylobacterium sp. TaxID=1871053 RepID=UPI002ED89FD8